MKHIIAWMLALCLLLCPLLASAEDEEISDEQLPRQEIGSSGQTNTGDTEVSDEHVSREKTKTQRQTNNTDDEISDEQLSREETLDRYQSREDDATDEVLVSSNSSITTGMLCGLPNRVIAVSLDNEPAARHYKGLSAADIVYEAEIYRGGYTRYVAIFHDDIPEKLLGVRSMWTSQADIASEYGCCFLYFGGMLYADTSSLQYVAESNVTYPLDLMQISDFFTRDAAREAPHNVEVYFNELYSAIDWTGMEGTCPLRFAENVYSVGAESATKISLCYRNGYTPTYIYDGIGSYYRYYDGARCTDGYTAQPITCSNIIMQYTTYTWQDENPNAPVMESVGTNKCEYFIEGTHFSGYWERNSLSENTSYYADDGTLVRFKPGKTYIQIVQDNILYTVE